MTQCYMVVRHEVADFSMWKTVYTGHLNAREKAGLKELYLLRNMENQNDVTLLFEVQDIEQAKAFVSSVDTREKIKESHVIGIPEIYFLK